MRLIDRLHGVDCVAIGPDHIGAGQQMAVRVELGDQCRRRIVVARRASTDEEEVIEEGTAEGAVKKWSDSVYFCRTFQSAIPLPS